MTSERTFIAIKPDGVQRGLIGEIIIRFERKGYKLSALKLIHIGEDLASKHYEEHKDKPFFTRIIKSLSSGPVCAMVWQGVDVIKGGRTLLGSTNPLEASVGTIRGDFSASMSRNVCHGSDSLDSAKREISLWFNEKDLIDWDKVDEKWVHD